MPLLSVIIPTFNRAVMLPRAVGSALAQTMRDFELLVVDDGSTDGTSALEILENPAIRVVRFDENRGVSFARNAGVRQSSGEWLAFLDSDDEWHPKKLERQVIWCMANPDARIMQCQEIWMRNGRRVNPPVSHRKTGGDIFAQSLARCMVTPSAVVMRRSLFDEAGGFDESFPACEDYDLWVRISCRCPVGLLDEYLVTRHGGRPDQLSARTPHLDTLRVRSLMRLLDAWPLIPKQAALVRQEIVRKAGYLANGSLKSGNQEDYERYTAIVEVFRR